MAFLVPPRRPSRERLDDPGLSAAEMRLSLADLRMVNRRWGASRAIERHLRSRVASWPDARVAVLDVGAGSGDVSLRLRRSLSRAGLRATVVALDRQWRHLAAGRSLGGGTPPLPVAADAFALPFPDGAFDFAVSTLFLHHFSPEENRRLLAEFRRVSRRGFAALDLRRHRIPELFVSLAGRVLFRTRISVEDGAASVRQAYTPEEVLEVARAVDAHARAERVFPFRFLVWGGA